MTPIPGCSRDSGCHDLDPAFEWFRWSLDNPYPAVPLTGVRMAQRGQTEQSKGEGPEGDMDPEDVWDPRVKVEESHYNWEDDPKAFEPLQPRDFDSPILVDLFSGAGGISAGFEQEGFDVALGADIHVPSIESFRQNHPQAAAILGDIREVSDEMILDAMGDVRPDVVAAGVPCQGFSISNRKRWKEDDRNYLFREFVRVVDLLEPDYVMLENVSGMKSTADGEFVEIIEYALGEAGPGYEVEHRMVDAANFGVPQRRERLVFLGSTDDRPLVWPRPTHGPGAPNDRLTVRDALSDLPSLEPYEQATEYDADPENDYQREMREAAQVLTSHEAPRHQSKTVERIEGTEPGEPMYDSFKQRVRLDPDEASPTVVAGGIRPQFSFGHPWDGRGLTVRERARLMSFPDSFHFSKGMVMGRVQTGQAVPPRLSRAFALGIRRSMALGRFRDQLLEWNQDNGREFAWRDAEDPFHVLMAEILLQKTRAENVEPVWREVTSEYPQPTDLAEADFEELEGILRPLGLSKVRAEALIDIGENLVRSSLGTVPNTLDGLLELREVGRYTANATLCFGFDRPRPIVDANVERIFERAFGIDPPRETHKDDWIWEFAAEAIPSGRHAEWNEALLDFGAQVCGPDTPDCPSCFATSYCEFYQRDGDTDGAE